ncbi:CHASE domain-containing protein [Marimonas sp. MJW-29]|uniref:histidine kinase n=1 Tax=Sulfitobacter sediminis TaxID=3234186 RepID=A0ABV3RJU6_9RHOB
MTAILCTSSVNYNQALASGEFERATVGTFDALKNRMRTYLQSLNGAAAFLSASDHVSATDFDNYVDTLEIAEFLPGINGIGFIEPIRSGDEDALKARMAAMGTPGLEIHPDTMGDERFVIVRISPLGPNKEALGLDITFEGGRRNAANESRATGEPRLTPRILLVQDATKKPGFLLLRPLYWEESLAQARPAGASGFRGWVYAPFVGTNLLSNLSDAEGNSFHFAVFDGITTDRDAIIYASGGEDVFSGDYSTRYEFDSFGRTWTVLFVSTPEFDSAVSSAIPFTIAIAGLLLTVMLVFTMRNMRIRSEALSELAAMRTREISARERENGSVIENAVTAVLILDAKDRILFANQAAQNCFGYDGAEITALRFQDIVTDIEGSGEHHNAVGVTKAGSGLVLDVQRNSWSTSEGVGRTTAIVRDLTAEHAAQAEIRKTKTSYDLALQGARIGVFDIDLETGKSDVSDSWRDLMGVPRGVDLDTQQEFLSRIHPDDLPILQAADAGCIEGRTPRSISEFRMAFPNDEWRWMRSDAVIVERDARGKALRMIGTQTDVTELRHSRNALEVSEQRFRQVLAAAPIGMALMDDEGRFTGVNQAFCNLVGREEEAMLRDVSISDILPSEELKKIYQGVMGLMNGELGGIYTAEHRLRNARGEELWGLLNISWTYDKNLGNNVFIAQVNDITDQKKLEQTKNEFVATVSHELRTPLTSIKGALGLILASEKNDLSAANHRLIEIARSNTDRLTAIVNDILDLEKISSGEVNFDFAPLDLNMLIVQSAKEMTPFAITHKNTLTVDVPDTPLWVNGDLGRTKQVLFNLISNACKYSDEDSAVVVKAEMLDGRAIVYVQNTGPGVPENFKPKMFGAFSQADASDTRARGGTGLGLNITRQIVRRHGGEIGFESIPNKVTVFWFTYPIALTPADQTLPVATAVPSRSDQDEKLRVLHLEDDEDFAEILRSGLGPIADITHVRSVPRARAALEKNSYEVLIVDCSHAEGDVLGLLDEIHKSQDDIRVVGLSADPSARNDRRLYADLEKSRTDLDTLARYVCGDVARAS